MPTYEYRCTDCGHEFEAVQSFSDDPISICPSCGGAVKKRFGNVGISFKGSGFYKTDSRGSGSKASSSSSSDSSSSSSSSDTSASGSSSTSSSDSSSSGSKDSSGSTASTSA